MDSFLAIVVPCSHPSDRTLRHIGDLNIYLRDVAVDVPRLRHLLWNGYVDEATRAVKNMRHQLDASIYWVILAERVDR